ncbi:Nicotinate dehydrogenase subunit A [bacterium HR08]|nr:Nicotinate dehydrogenase subunit A [bacterium HR08]
MREVIELYVNGVRHRLEVEPNRSLLSVLREDLDLTGAKYGCGEGQCGACTVLVAGRATRSCTTPVHLVAGRSILTIEGLARDGRLHPLQEAFLEVGALQCGYCTPGMIMSGVALLNANPDPSEAEIIRFMNGHICRCGTYGRIVRAIQRAAQKMKEARP